MHFLSYSRYRFFPHVRPKRILHAHIHVNHDPWGVAIGFIEVFFHDQLVIHIDNIRERVLNVPDGFIEVGFGEMPMILVTFLALQ